MSEGRPHDHDGLLRHLAANVESIRDAVGDIQGQVEQLTQRVDRIEDRMATKDDVTFIRGDIERVELRLDLIDRAVTTRHDQFDLSLSRLRSAVYLLAKDQPEVLRLLGQE